MTDYTHFTLDGFHNRTVEGWRKVKSRVDCAAYTAPGYWPSRGGRYVPARQMPEYSIVECYPWRKMAREHAKEHGAAGVWMADDSLVLFYRDSGKVRTKTFPHARPV